MKRCRAISRRSLPSAPSPISSRRPSPSRRTKRGPADTHASDTHVAEQAAKPPETPAAPPPFEALAAAAFGRDA